MSASSSRVNRQLNLPPTPLESVQAPDCSGLNRLQAWKGLVTLAMARAGVQSKRMAAFLGITPQQFSNQLAYDGDTRNEHLSLWRLLDAPPEFWIEFITLLCDFHQIAVNGTQREREDRELGRLVRELVTRVVAR